MSRTVKGPRAPSPDDLRLWREVAKSVKPIGRIARDAELPPAATPPDTDEERPEPDRTRQRARTVAKSPPPPSPRPAAIDRRTAGKVARGRLDIDARIDLHGLTQAAAHRRLATFLHDAQARGARIALVITGKGRADGPREVGQAEPGVLRRSVPHWLGSAELRPYVAGFGPAARNHGGGGALYVRIRRLRR